LELVRVSERVPLQVPVPYRVQVLGWKRVMRRAPARLPLERVGPLVTWQTQRWHPAWPGQPAPERAGQGATSHASRAAGAPRRERSHWCRQTTHTQLPPTSIPRETGAGLGSGWSPRYRDWFLAGGRASCCQTAGCFFKACDHACTAILSQACADAREELRCDGHIGRKITVANV
jgi:hypothetical protein